MFKDSCRPVKTTHQYFPWSFLFPFPSPPRKKSTTYPKTSSHQDLFITNVLTQVQIPWTSPIYESTVSSSQRIRTRDEQVTTCLCRQEHTSQVLLPSCGDYTLSPCPVRGSTRPSTPLSPHWREEDNVKSESPKTINFFFFSELPVAHNVPCTLLEDG
jgi:hypothetical protein